LLSLNGKEAKLENIDRDKLIAIKNDESQLVGFALIYWLVL
jgi:hypothetical protein